MFLYFIMIIHVKGEHTGSKSSCGNTDNHGVIKAAVKTRTHMNLLENPNILKTQTTNQPIGRKHDKTWDNETKKKHSSIGKLIRVKQGAGEHSGKQPLTKQD